MCQSRIFDELYVNGEETYAFIPYSDMMNHKDPADTEWEFEESENCFVMKIIIVRFLESGMDSYSC